jgi:hypothetical protein
MAGFLFRLETVDGAPAEPPTFATAVPSWLPGDTIPLGKRTLRVIGKRDDDADQPPVLVVESDEQEDGRSRRGLRANLGPGCPGPRDRNRI